ncbi:MAG: hypothetical protein QXG39_00060 [Candidatus Aenigmatarchaeota archaeon]
MITRIDEVYLTICPTCGWIWLKKSEKDKVCKSCLDKFRKEYEGLNLENIKSFEDFLDEKILKLKKFIKENVRRSESGLVRVRDICWFCGYNQSVVFYEDRKSWVCVKDGTKNDCRALMKLINHLFNYLTNTMFRLVRVTEYKLTKKGRMKILSQSIRVLGQELLKIDVKENFERNLKIKNLKYYLKEE